MRENNEIIELVLAAQHSPVSADNLIRKYMPFIKAETAKFMKRIPIEGIDDELSISMFAFYEAAMAYKRNRGSFLKLAAMAIRNRLIDYYRHEKRYHGVVSLDCPVSEEENGQSIVDQLPDQKNTINEMTDLSATKSEIEEFERTLSTYQLNLSDVADNCPKQNRTLNACLKALQYAKEHPTLLEQLVTRRKLPIQQLSDQTGVAKKTLERHRKYMMAILLAYTNGFEIIRGHLCQIQQEGGKTL